MFFWFSYISIMQGQTFEKNRFILFFLIKTGFYLGFFQIPFFFQNCLYSIVAPIIYKHFFILQYVLVLFIGLNILYKARFIYQTTVNQLVLLLLATNYFQMGVVLLFFTSKNHVLATPTGHYQTRHWQCIPSQRYFQLIWYSN